MPRLMMVSLVSMWTLLLHGAAMAAAGFDLHAAVAGATAGSTVRVPAGQYRGPLVIDKPLTLIADEGAVIDAAGEGDVVRITAADVTFRGFTLRNTGSSLDRENAGISVSAARATLVNNRLEDVLFGIYLRQSPGSVIRGNEIGGKDFDIARRGDAIRLWYSPDVVIEDNRVTRSRDVVMWFSKGVQVRRNHVTAGRYGLHFMYADENVLEDNHVQGNSVGAFLMYSRNLVLRGNTFADNRGSSGYGLGLKEMDGLRATDNRIIGNRVGIFLDNSPRQMDITHELERNLIAYNDIGVAFMPSVKRNHFVDNAFIDNVEQVAVLGGGSFSGNSFTIAGRGNFWSDYGGYDLDGDGLGDIPLVSRSLFENLMDREPKLRMFLFSPAQQAVEMAAKALPSLQPQPKFTDEAPLMQPVRLKGLAVQASTALPMSAAGLGLLIIGGAVMLGIRRFGAALRVVTPPAVVVGPAPVVERPLVRELPSAKPQAAAETETILRVEDLVCAFGRFRAVNGLSFTMKRGESLALWGHNGAGKTTAIKCLLDLVRSKGSVTVAGHDLRSASKLVRRQIGYVSQELCFYDNWTGREAMAFYARLKRVAAAEIPQALEQVGLGEHAHKKVGAMSGGMKQRLALAIALLGDPPILVLDEMTSNLDNAARLQLVHLLVEQKRAGKSLLFASHRLEEVAALADRVLVLESGRLKRECTPAELPSVVGLTAELKVQLPPDEHAAAIALLQDEGFDAVASGGRIVTIHVEPRTKALPLAYLIQRGFAIEDLDIDHDSHDPMAIPTRAA